MKKIDVLLRVPVVVGLLVTCSATKENVQNEIPISESIIVEEQLESPDSQQPSSTAETEVFEFMGVEITYQNPDKNIWSIGEKRVDEKSERGMLLFKRKAIYDAEGRKIIPNFGITCVKLPPDLPFNNFFVLTAARMGAKEMYNLLNYVDGHFKTQPSGGFYFKTSYGGLGHTIIYGNIMKNGIGLTLIGDATDGVFAECEKDFLAFIKSVDIR